MPSKQVSGEGWLLKEQLEKHNDGLGCKGDEAEVVLTHLKGSAYIEVKGETLYYFYSKGKPLAHSFVRRGTWRAAPNMVLYRPLYNDSGMWVRPYDMFVGQVNVGGVQRSRFEAL